MSYEINFEPTRNLVHSLSEPEAKCFESLRLKENRNGSKDLRLFLLLRESEQDISRAQAEELFKKEFPRSRFQDALERLKENLLLSLNILDTSPVRLRNRNIHDLLDRVCFLCEKESFWLADQLLLESFQKLKEIEPGQEDLYLYSKFLNTFYKVQGSGPWALMSVKDGDLEKIEMFDVVKFLINSIGANLNHNRKFSSVLAKVLNNNSLYYSIQASVSGFDRLKRIREHMELLQANWVQDKLLFGETKEPMTSHLFLIGFEGLYLSYRLGESDFFFHFFDFLNQETFQLREKHYALFAFLQLRLWDLEIRFRVKHSVPNGINSMGEIESLLLQTWRTNLKTDLKNLDSKLYWNSAITHFLSGFYDEANSLFKKLHQASQAKGTDFDNYSQLYSLICEAEQPRETFDKEYFNATFKTTKKLFAEDDFIVKGLKCLEIWVKNKGQYSDPDLPDLETLSEFKWPLWYWMRNHRNHAY